MFNFIKQQTKKIYTSVTQKIHKLFLYTRVDQTALDELELILLQADTGVTATKNIIASLYAGIQNGTIIHGTDLKVALEALLNTQLPEHQTEIDADIFLLVGINGTGKTTFAAKLANLLQEKNKSVTMVAADTFRAAAPEQLRHWATLTGSNLISGTIGQDPAAVVFQACQKTKDIHNHALIIDTAGRLQTKINLMHELDKMKRVINKQLPNKKLVTLLTIDAMLGQNSLIQAQIFHQSVSISEIVLTKMDGSAKGGILFAIYQQLKIPIGYISHSEQLDGLKLFDKQIYIQDLLNI